MRKPSKHCPTHTQRHDSPCENDHDRGRVLDLWFGMRQTRGFFNHSLKFTLIGSQTQNLSSATQTTNHHSLRTLEHHHYTSGAYRSAWVGYCAGPPEEATGSCRSGLLEGREGRAIDRSPGGITELVPIEGTQPCAGRMAAPKFGIS
jgi:hypothetical protein